MQTTSRKPTRPFAPSRQILSRVIGFTAFALIFSASARSEENQPALPVVGHAALPSHSPKLTIPIPPWMCEAEALRRPRDSDQGMVEALTTYPSTSDETPGLTAVQLISQFPGNAKTKVIRFRQSKPRQ